MSKVEAYLIEDAAKRRAERRAEYVAAMAALRDAIIEAFPGAYVDKNRVDAVDAALMDRGFAVKRED